MPPSKTILKAALLVGSLDIAAAFIHFYIQTDKLPFKPVLGFIATGLVGKESGLDSTAMMFLGLVLHFFIATAFTVFFFLTVARWKAVKSQWLFIGILYGAFTWAVMNMIVLPIAFSRPFTFNLSKNALAMGILILCVGIPLVFIASRQKVTIMNRNN